MDFIEEIIAAAVILVYVGYYYKNRKANDNKILKWMEQNKDLLLDNFTSMKNILKVSQYEFKVKCTGRLNCVGMEMNFTVFFFIKFIFIYFNLFLFIFIYFYLFLFIFIYFYLFLFVFICFYLFIYLFLFIFIFLFFYFLFIFICFYLFYFLFIFCYPK